ncbi:putative DNA-binding protein [Gracilibacillus sp. YIM 98692]|uniref:putative DNA-binding protein n=1 Tax=Gracilibacillus sp. YIM 98692 TaxID=2663532 RepID=UPI0013D4557B|nr:putative DNA-binding protein [Gracilibacillus sp. YIM 98692]
MLEKTTRINYLYDFYQGLLTPKQRNYMEMYYLEDLSLGEISEHFNVSRQAIYDNIRRTEQMLEEYEEKLGLYRKFQKRQELLGYLKQHTNNEKTQQIVDKIIEIE